MGGDIGLFSFMNRKLAVDELILKGTKINIRELSNGTYNYSHIIDHLESEEDEDVNDPSNSWSVSLKAMEIENTQFDFSSVNSEVKAHIPQLRGDLKKFSIQESIFHFHSLASEGIIVSYDKSDNIQIDEVENSISFPSLPFTLIIDDISIKSNDLSYNTDDPLLTSSEFDPNHISIENPELEGKNLSWGDSIHFDLKKLSIVTSDGFQIDKLTSELHLSNQSMTLGQTQIQTPTSNISFDGNAIYEEFDFLISEILKNNSKLSFQKSTISKKDISYFLDKKSLSIIDLEYLEDIELQGNLYLNSDKLDVQNISIKSGTDLAMMGSLGFSNITNINKSNISFDITNINTNQSYIERLLPTFQFPPELNNLGNINGNASGIFTGDEMNFETINLNTSEKTRISGSGKIYAFQDKKGSEMEFYFIDLETNLNSLVAESTNIPDEVKRLENIKYSGLIKGSVKDFAIDGKLSTSLGDLDLDTKIEFTDDFTDATYEGYIKTQDFDLGTMLNDTTFGVINFDGNIKGRGMSIDKLETMVDGKIKSIYYDGNTYNDISLDGAYRNKVFEGKVVSRDKHVNFDIDGKLNFSGPKPILNVVMDMKNFDLEKLGISDSLMVLGGIFRGKANGSSLDDIIGDGTIENFSIRTQKGSFFADSTISVKAERLNQFAKIYSIDSPFLEGEIKGKIEPSSLIQFISNYIKTYIPLESGYDEKIEDNPSKFFVENDTRDFILSARTKDINPFLIPFLGNKFSIKEASLYAYFSGKETKLDLKGKIDSLLYNGILLQRGSFFFDGRKSFINGNINIEDISMDNEILIPQATINTVLNHKIADFNMIMANEDDVERLNLSGDLTRTDEYIMTFNDSIFLNGFNWKFSPFNQIIFGDYGLYMQDLKLSKEDQAITIYTDENENGEAIEVLFDNFTLSELTAIINKKNDYFEGNIDGSLMINSLYFKPFITADLNLKNATIANRKAGNISLIAIQDPTSNSVKSKIRLSGPQNDVTLALDYGIEHQTTIGTLDIGKLEMTIIDPYLTDIFINSEGYVNGKININGNINNPDLKGILRTHNVKTTPVFTNSRYAVLDTDISFSDTKIDFGTIELTDKNGNSAFVSGKISHKNLKQSVVDLNVKTDNFEFLNTTENENELFYGNVNISGNISINGPIDNIEIYGTATAVNSSGLNVSPLSLEDDLFADDFIIYSGDPRKIPSDSLRLDAKNPGSALPFDVEIKITVEEDSEFSMILNPITGDKLTCNGTSNLTLKLKKNGEMELYGTYTVSKGSYTFSYSLITKEFTIQPGSTVRFNGDPFKGVLDVNAVYVANTAVYDLIKFESELTTDAQKSEAQRKRDINVVLNLTKSIEKPEIQLDITTSEDEFSSSIIDILKPKLDQLREEPDELNNQVFGLLLFDNFILAKNAETDLAKTGTDIAISSISGLVTQQLNKLADGLIEGFEVNFDVNSYSSDFLSKGQEGVATEFGFGIKKNLFDDRLSLSAGTNINLESDSRKIDFGTIVGDFILGYKINKDGSFKFNAYRKSSFDRFSGEGNSAKNGVGLFVRKEFGEIKKNKN